MKKILFLTYFFPPDSASATQRIAKFAKYLNDFDYHPLILKPSATQGQNQDPKSFEELKNKVTLYPTFSLASLFKKSSHPTTSTAATTSPSTNYSLLTTILPIDPQILWAPFVIFKALKIIKKEKPKVIFASGYPFSLFIAGAIIKKLTKTPLVLSYHDPWTLNPYMPKWNSWLNRKLESWCIKTSDACIFTTTGTQTLYESQFPKQNQKFHTIYNGFDPEDFISSTKEASLPKNKTNLTYIGSLTGDRSPQPIIDTVTQLTQEHPELKEKIRLNFYGPIDPQFKTENSNLITFHDFLPHDQAINTLRQSDILLFLTGDKPGGEHIVAGKTFEYMATHRPIFALTYPDGEAATILKKSGLGHVVSQDDITSAAKTLYILYKSLQTNTINQQIDNDFIKKFSRKNLTQQLAKIFNQISK